MIEIDRKNLQKAYEHLESALSLLKDLKIKSFVSRFYYGILWFLNGIFKNLTGGKWHERKRYEKVFDESEHAILGKIWEYFKALRFVADYGYYQGKSWSEYEEKFWEEAPEKVEQFLDYLRSLEDETLEIILIKEKAEEIRIWLTLISNVKK